MLLEELRFAKGIDPIADAFAGTVNTDVYSMKEHGRVLFCIYTGVGASGTSTITVDACDDTTPSNTTAIAFWSAEMTSGDTMGSKTRRAAAGYVYTAGSSKMVFIEAEAKDLPSDYGFVRCHLVESVNAAVLACIFPIMGGNPSRYLRAEPATIIS
jgi:hypothetical protein